MKERAKAKPKKPTVLSPVALSKLSLVEPKIRNKKGKVEKAVDDRQRAKTSVAVEKLLAKERSTKITKRSVLNPRSDEDFRKVMLRKIRRLHKIAFIIERSILTEEGGTRLVYQLGQVYSQLDASIDSLRELKSAEMRVDVINRRLLVPSFRKVVSVCTDLVNEIRLVNKKLSPEKVRARFDQEINRVLTQYGQRLQEVYDKTLEQAQTVAEEDI